MMVFVKVVLLLVAALSHNIGLIPPQPPAADEDKVYKGQLFEQVVHIWVYGTRAMISALVLSQSVALLSGHYAHPYSSHILSNVCPASSPALATIATITFPFLCGFALMILSSLLRVWCFATLGSLFTYEVAVKTEHKLVTSGPYAYVRHPSYSGVFFMLLGTLVTFLSPGNYITECGIWTSPAKWIVYTWFCCASYCVFALCKRGAVEDALMRESFGEEWLQYRREVPYKFLPGIY